MYYALAFAKMMQWDFWFSAYPGRLSRTFLIAGVVICEAFVLGAVIFRLAQVYYRPELLLRAIVRRCATLATSLGILGLVFIFFRQEEVYFLSSRAWFFVWGIAAVWAVISLIRVYQRQRNRILQAPARA